ncbi:MAG: YceH family protein [Pirellula sp.]|nr:YceH family protein [Pirellula sp.]
MDQESQLPIEPSNETPREERAWKPLSAKQRRVLGTLMEKSKTTPDAYPMSFTGLATGCNQKSNREPVTNYSAEQVETIVDELRALGAVTIVQGSGRVTKVRHYAYNWLGLNKVEAAVMTELLLRGEQTIGELRNRASRMEPIADLAQMQQIFDELKRRELVLELTPPGRGQLVSHNLYPEWERDQLLEKSIGKGGEAEEDDSAGTANTRIAKSGSSSDNSKLAEEIEQLKELISSLTARLTHIEKELGI